MVQLPALRKYPRTRHIEGSRLQPGDEDLSQVALSDLRGQHLVVEEKVDGGQFGVSFSETGELLLQSRGHYLTGGSAFEAQFDVAKAWAQTHRDPLWQLLGSRLVMYGECVYKKHTVFYDHLPHYVLEFDVLDLESGRFLSTARRRALFAGSPVVSVPVLHEGSIDSYHELVGLVRPSAYKSAAWRATFERIVRERGLDIEREWQRCDLSDLAEGLYIKGESEDFVALDEASGTEARYKWVRHDFHQLIVEANADARGHVAFQPLIPNQLAPGVDLWSA